MGLGVSFRIAPGVRVRASTRGIRTSIGPRAARVHVGGGRTRVSTGAGPFTVSAPVGGGRRPTTRSSAPSRPRQPTVAQLQAQARAAERAQQIADITVHEQALTTLHLASFEQSTRQVLPVPAEPTAADVTGVRRELFRSATTGVPLWKREPRKQAKAWAAEQAPEEARRRHIGALVQAQLEQAELDEHWEALLTHEPLTVIEAVDAAFADNASDSTCVDAGTDPATGGCYVTAVVSYGGVHLVPEQRPDVTPGGKPTLRKRTKTDRNALYATAIASTVLATVKEALAVAVAATEVRVLVVRPTGLQGLEAVYAGTFTRAALSPLRWRDTDPLAVAMAAGGAQMARKGSTREVVALLLDDDSGTGQLLEALARA